ncbi:MAG: TRAP transporter small permease, partial [Chloroflexota bacterium]|nr:TRAP transporter small permease [Chloroflexota bacterium]
QTRYLRQTAGYAETLSLMRWGVRLGDPALPPNTSRNPGAQSLKLVDWGDYLKQVSKILDGINRAGIILVGIILVFIMLMVNTDIFMRYFFNRPIIWSVEISENALLFATFLGAAWVLAKGKHVRIDTLTSRLSRRGLALFNIATYVLCALVTLAFVWYGSLVTLDHYRRGLFVPTFLNIPNAYILFIIPLGSLLLFLQFLREINKSWQIWRGHILEEVPPPQQPEKPEYIETT